MTNQVNQAFEEWIPPYWNKNKHIDDEGVLVYSDDLTQGAFIGYRAATQASESEINSLKQRVGELGAENTIMRETLNKIALGYVYDADIIESAGDCLQRLCTKKSLAEHDNEVIDRCKNIVADDALAITFQSMGAYRSAIIKALKEMKAEI